MSVTARDLYFVLRVRDEASNVLSGVSRDILKIGAAAQASSARAQAASLRQMAANARAAGEQKAEALKSAAAQERETAAQMRAAGATKDQIAAVDAQARAYARQAAEVSAATDKEVASFRKQAAAYDLQAKNLEKEVAGHQQLSRTLNDVSSAATATGLVLVGVGALGVAALMSTVKAGVEYDRQVALTKTQVDGFSASLKQLGQEGKDVASNIGVSFDQMQSTLFDIFSSTNANLAQSKTLLTAFAKAAVAGQVSMEDAGRSTMSIMNAFKIPIGDVNTVLDKQFQLVRKGVGTYGQFANVIGKLTPSAVRLGQNLDTMDATLIFLTRNGLSTASAVAAAARAMDALANPNTTGKLDALGIASRDASGKFLPLVDILKNMRKYLLALPAPDRAEALFNIFKGSGGTIQAKRFFDLVLPNAKSAGSLDQFIGFLNDMKNSSGQFNQAYKTLADTVASKTQVLKNNFNIMKTSIGQDLEPEFKKLLDFGSKLIGFFNGLSPATQGSLAKFALMASAITIIVGGVVLFIGALGALAAALAAIGLDLGPVLLITAAVAAGFVAIGGAVVAAIRGSAPIQKLFHDIGQTFSDVWSQDIQPFAQNVRAIFDQQLLPALQALWAVVNNKVVPVLDTLWNEFGKKLTKDIGEAAGDIRVVLIVAFATLTEMINKFVIPTIDKLSAYYDKHKTAIDKVVAAVAQLVKWTIILMGGGALAGLVVVVAAVIAVFLIIIKVITTAIQMISTLVRWAKDAYNAMDHFGDGINHASTATANAVGGALKGLVNWFENLPGRIKSALSGFAGLLISSGHDLIAGLEKGIDNATGGLLGKAANLGSKLKGAFNAAMSIFSPSRVMAVSGMQVVAGIGVGIDQGTPALLKKVKNMASNVKASVDVSSTQAPVVPYKRSGSGDGKQVVVNVYTQEIRPEYHAQQLGNLIASTF